MPLIKELATQLNYSAPSARGRKVDGWIGCLTEKYGEPVLIMLLHIMFSKKSNFVGRREVQQEPIFITIRMKGNGHHIE